MKERIFQTGELIIREGEHDDSLFRVLEGSAEVIVGEGSADPTTLTTMGPDRYFGELALLGGYPHTASVKAVQDGTKILEIPYAELSGYVAEHPELMTDLMKSVGDRIRELTVEYDDACNVLAVVRGKDEGKKKGLAGVIDKYVLNYQKYKNIDKESAEAAREKEDHSAGFNSEVVSYPSGTIICKEGDPANCMYDIHYGKVGVFTGYGTPDEVELTELYANSFFGEMGMLDQKPRSATCVALADDTTLEIITPEDLQELAVKNPPKMGMILRHLGDRLRRLTADYVEVCKQVTDSLWKD